MNNIKISLIFACYNVAEYLEKLYKLVINQPYKNIEVIFVEDCSTDNTKEILRTFTDPRVKLIENASNQGAAISRNIGMDYATGDYIWFPDPDDLFDEKLIIETAEIIKEVSPSVVICGMFEEYENNNILKYRKEIISLYSGHIKENINNILLDLEDKLLFGYTNNKFYKSSILSDNNIKTKKLALKEDFDFNIQFFNIINEFYILNKPYYFYKKRLDKTSLSAKFVPEYFDIHYNTILQFQELLQNKGKINYFSEKLLVNRFFRYFLSAIERNTNRNAKMSISEQQKWIGSILKNNQFSYFFNNIHLLSNKLRVIFLLKSPGILLFIGFIIKFMKKNLTLFFAKLK